MPVRTLVLWCPDWPVVAARPDHLDHLADLEPGLPVAVVFANRVVACSPSARERGVRRGLRRREAQGRCPEVVVVERDEAREARAFEAVAAALDGTTPRVELTRPGWCCFPTRGPSRYFGGDHALAARVVEAVDAVVGGLTTCRVGVADGPFAAGLAARRTSARALVVPPGETPRFLAPFPVTALERPELAELFGHLGLRTLGDLAALSPADLLGRFGQEGLACHRLASGFDERPPATRRPPPDLEVGTELEPPAERVDQAAFVAKSLADRLHDELARRGLACTRLLVVAETEHGERLERLWRHEGTLSAAAVAQRVRWQLDGWLSQPIRRGTTPDARGTSGARAEPDDRGAPDARGRRGPPDEPDARAAPGARGASDIGVHPGAGGTGGKGGATVPAAACRPTGGLARLVLVPHEVVPATGRQLGFWGGDSAAGERALRALARVQGLVGPAAVTVPERQGGRAPGEVVVLVPLDSADLDGPRAGERADHPWPGRLPAPSPALVHRHPRAAQVLDADGTLVEVSGRGGVSAPPALLSVAGGPWLQVVSWAGPWPVDERWWDPVAHRRRARFQLVTAAGTAHLITREAGHWFEEAVYD